MARLGVVALLLLAGCAAPPPVPLWVAEPGLVYCYATLAAPDCFRQPQPGAERRLTAAAPKTFFKPFTARNLDISAERD
jgi:hypothetical protein